MKGEKKHVVEDCVVDDCADEREGHLVAAAADVVHWKDENVGREKDRSEHHIDSTI